MLRTGANGENQSKAPAQKRDLHLGGGMEGGPTINGGDELSTRVGVARQMSLRERGREVLQRSSKRCGYVE